MNKSLIFNVKTEVDAWNELRDLIELHRLELRGDEAPSEPRRDWYDGMANDGRLLFFTARERSTEKLVGYATVLLTRDNQREGELNAHQDAIFILKSNRNGFAGCKFIRYIERQCSSRGVSRLFQSVTPANDFSVLLLRGGYTEDSTVYRKTLE